ncbi:peptidoglycan-binding protein [Streptomyces sp. NRRL S-350]|uniref:C40 family peptidase n=1 Tax=Streptomyces sp. NRRL S-350 TaxID=1463902 RepID=UPI0004BE56A1|nr:peptidoglycan-binding protein [Streptomyces sp. NRRL S-350]
MNTLFPARRRLSLGLALAAVLTGVGAYTAAAAAAATAPTPVPLTSAACPAVLQQGEADGCVTQLQLELNRTGATLTVDGQFGPATGTAVRTFQASHALSVDGIVGPATKSALDAAAASGTGTGTGTVDLRTQCGTLQTGASGPCVTTLQTMLNTFNAGRLTVDGQFGPATGTAVRNFQAAHALTIDGIVGTAVKNALYADTPTPLPSGPVDPAKVLNAAKSYLGVPYVWGGGHSLRGEGAGPSLGTCDGYTGSIQPCPADTTAGLDCSGLVRAAFWFGAGIDLANGGDTTDQTLDKHLTPITEAQRRPGDVEYFGTDAHTTVHVVLYAGTDPATGTDMMYEAKETGTDVHYVGLRTGGYWYHVTA